MTALEFAKIIQEKFGSAISAPTEFRGETTLVLSDSGKIVELAAFLKNELHFDYLADISSVDLLEETQQFQVVYEIYNYQHQCHLRIKTPVTESLASPPFCRWNMACGRLARTRNL